MAAKPKPLPLTPAIRTLRPEEAAIAAQIVQEAETAAVWSTESIAKLLASRDALALVSERDGAITGFITGRQIGHEAEVLNLAVRKSWRRKGEGSALLCAALDKLAERGVTRVFLEVRESNQNALAFYAKHGFVPSGHRKAYYRDPIEDAVCMEKKIGSGPV